MYISPAWRAAISLKYFIRSDHGVAGGLRTATLPILTPDTLPLPFMQSRISLNSGENERGNEAWTLRLLGEIAARCDPPEVEQAETHYHEALTLANELGMRPL